VYVAQGDNLVATSNGLDLTQPLSSPKNMPMLSTGNSAGERAGGLRLTSQILLALHVLSLGHLLSVRHLTCPQHGDIIHVEHSAETSPAQVDAGWFGSLPMSIAATEPALDTDHDHCLACVDTNTRSLPIAAAHSLGSEVVTIGVFHANRAAFFAPVDLILLSPKNSPPSA
jgi:hypothetical protein